jgi:hypothetical protein
MAEHPNGSIVRRFFAAHAASSPETNPLECRPTVVGLSALAE